MAYVPDEACLAAARAAAGDELRESDILAAFKRIADYKERLEKSGDTTGINERIRKFAEEEGERTKIAAALARKQTALNIVIRDKAMEQIGHMMAAGLTPQQSMLALLEGSVRGVKNARKSVASFRQSFEAKFLGHMLSDIEKTHPHLMSLMDDAALDADVLREMKELAPGGKPGSTGNKDAQYLASTFAKYAEAMRLKLNKLGANIGKIDDWGGVQTHDPVKLMRVAPEVWAARTIAYLDIERTFPDGLSEREVMDVLTDIYNTILTGVPKAKRPGELGQRLGPANMAKQLNAHRVLHFKNADAAIAYRKEFGYGNTISGMFHHLRDGARFASNMQVLGPNPETMFVSIAEELQRRIRNSSAISPADKVKLVQGLQTDIGAQRHALDIAIGIQAIPGHMKWAEIGSGIRMFQSIAKLGGALISSLTDPVTVAASASFRGSSFFDTFAQQLSMTFSGRPKGEAAELAYLFGEGYDGITHHISSAFGALDGPIGQMSRLQEIFFRLNGLTWWTDAGRGAAARIVAAEMGMRAGKSFKDLPPAYSHVLGLHGIDAARWELIRSSKLKQVNGKDYITPDRIREIPDDSFAAYKADDIAKARERIEDDMDFEAKRQQIIDDARDDLEMDVIRFVGDETSFGMIEADPRSRRTTTWGTRPGTVAGEAMRFIMQFKGWPIAFTQRVLGREVYGRRKGSWKADNPVFWSETMPHIGTLLAGLTLAGYASMTVKDALKGYGARDPGDPRTWMAALQQGGAWGIYGDFLFSTNNRFGGGLVETLAGPTLGTVGDLWNISADARDAALTGGDDSFSSARAFSSVWANVPGANLFWAKPALDYMFLNSLRETLSPGYLRRQDKRRLDEYGQGTFDPLGIGRTMQQ